MSVADEQPFAALSPDAVLAAAEALGIECDGRLFALNSYENRVYQLGSADQGTLVFKFYRPARWSDAQILEEHAFALELAAAELPVVAPLRFGEATLFHRNGLRYAAFPRRAARAVELDSFERQGLHDRAQLGHHRRQHGDAASSAEIDRVIAGHGETLSGSRAAAPHVLTRKPC
jgi:Ser/Thr protein kinase RdoA (MazF antagonist)